SRRRRRARAGALPPAGRAAARRTAPAQPRHGRRSARARRSGRRSARARRSGRRSARARSLVMIASLAGTLAEKSPDRLVVDVAGVGYLVYVSLQTFSDLPPAGASVRLLVHTEVREDAIELFGFADPRERALFHLLRKVKGLGPRTSLGVLSGMPVAELLGVVAGDAARLQTMPGVGKRFAERIVVECREGAATLAAAGRAQPSRVPLPGASEEAVSALVNLGYRRPEAERAVQRVTRNGESL